VQKIFILVSSLAVLMASCSENEPDLSRPKIRRAVEFAHAGFQPGPDCVLKGSVSMPAQNLEPLRGETGGAEVDFFHDLMRKALRMEANLVAPDTEVEAATAAASGEAFSGQAYWCPG
jgi:hypothetical protein